MKLGFTLISCVRADGCIAGALHTAAQRVPGSAPHCLRKSASDVASLSGSAPVQSAAQHSPGRQAPLSRRASCTEATMAAERSRRPSLGDNPSSGPSAGWHPLLQDLPGNFLLVPEPASEASTAGIPCPQGVAIPQAPSQSLSRKESFESVRARSLQRDDSSFSNHNSSPASVAASSLVSRSSPCYTIQTSRLQPWHVHGQIVLHTSKVETILRSSAAAAVQSWHALPSQSQTVFAPRCI